MNYNDAFPSNYLKAADIRDREPTVILKDIKIEPIGEDRKMVAYFEKASKGMVLNKTNATMIGDLYGPDTDDWLGKPVKLVAAWVDFQGRQVEAIRVRPPDRLAPARQTAAAAPASKQDTENPAPFDDDIPF